MRKQYIFIFLIFILLNGCFRERHLEFNNVPINGNLDKFTGELIQSGVFESKSTEKNVIEFSGVFLDKDCEIYVYGTRKSQIAYKVTVNLPEEVSDSLEYSFDKIQKLFNSKYGKGTSRYQQYRNSERFLFNEPKRIRHLNKGDFTRYTLDSGIIIIEVSNGFISITYSDKLNNKINAREMKE